jgi:hypothetical protein
MVNPNHSKLTRLLVKVRPLLVRHLNYYVLSIFSPVSLNCLANSYAPFVINVQRVQMAWKVFPVQHRVV